MPPKSTTNKSNPSADDKDKDQDQSTQPDGEQVDLAGLVETAILDQMQVTDTQIVRWFEHRTPDQEQLEKISRVRSACAACAQIIKNSVPGSPDQTAAIRKVREASMTAVAAIVCQGR